MPRRPRSPTPFSRSTWSERTRGERVRSLAGKVLYWVAVVAIALAVLVALVLFFESRDESTLDAGSALWAAILRPA